MNLLLLLSALLSAFSGLGSVVQRERAVPAVAAAAVVAMPVRIAGVSCVHRPGARSIALVRVAWPVRPLAKLSVPALPWIARRRE